MKVWILRGRGKVFLGSGNLERILRTAFLNGPECTHRLSEPPVPHRCLRPKTYQLGSHCPQVPLIYQARGATQQAPCKCSQPSVSLRLPLPRPCPFFLFFLHRHSSLAASGLGSLRIIPGPYVAESTLFGAILCSPAGSLTVSGVMPTPPLSPRSWPGWQEEPLPRQLPGTRGPFTPGGSGRSGPCTWELGENYPQTRPALLAQDALRRAERRATESGRWKSSPLPAQGHREILFGAVPTRPSCQPGLLSGSEPKPLGR